MATLRVRMGIGLEWSPWRVPSENFKWNKDTADEIRKDILKILPSAKSGVSQFKVLTIGPRGHGKSSLINSFGAISEEKKTYVANTLNTSTSYRSYELLGDFKQLRFGDIKGLQKKTLYKMKPFLKDIELLIDGKIKSGYEFVDESISEESKFFVADPTISDKIHCVILVFDCKEVYDIHKFYTDSIMELLETFNKKNIPVMVVLTKADCLSPHIKYDIASLFRCRLIRDAVDKASKQLSISKAKIFPVVNFEDKDLYRSKDALPVLLVLQACLLMARAHSHNAN